MYSAILYTCIITLPLPIVALLCYFDLKAKEAASILMLCWGYAMFTQLMTFLFAYCDAL